MPYNGSGTFNRIYDWTTDEGNGIDIEAIRMDAEDDGFASGLSNAITKDGQTTIVANIPFNSKKITGLGNGSVRTDSITLGQVQDNTYEYLGENGGAADAYTWNPSPAISAYTEGQTWRVKIGSGDSNTGASTANINALGTRTINKSDGAGSTTALESSDMIAGGVYEFVDNGTTLTLQNPEKPYLNGSNITPIAGSLQSIQVFTSSGTWNKPANIGVVIIDVVGGGGGGGGAASGSTNRAAGGGGGGYARKYISSGLGATETITIGGGGIGGNSSGTAGATGGSSSFGAHVSATGGGGGGGSGSGSGGTGGAGSSGDINQPGGCGQSVYFSSTTSPAGGGGSSFMGGGGAGSTGAGDSASVNSGGGGAGGQNNNSGGSGGSGIIVVYEFI
jgi:hypothetical protein